MRHLKLFKESITTTYTEITASEFNDYIFDVPVDEDGDEVEYESEDWDSSKVYSRWVGFSDSEINTITDVVFKCDRYVEVYDDYVDNDTGDTQNLKYMRIDHQIDNKTTGAIQLYHLKDDWYYAHHTITNYAAKRFRCYRCDQIDGLLDCLKNIL